MSVHQMGVVELTEYLGRLLQGYGKFQFQAPPGSPNYLQAQLDQVARELRSMTQRVAKTKTPFYVVYTLTSRLFNEQDSGHMWKGGVRIVASAGNEQLAQDFRTQSTAVWFRMMALHEECGFLP